ncbi:protein-L-isoaspartate(D-aspartate) O-methyltransferase, partial [Actinomycetota bacterium]
MFFRKYILKRVSSILRILLILIMLISFSASCKEAGIVEADKGEASLDETELTEEQKYEILRYDMIFTQIVPRGISDANTINAMNTVPRHEFVSENQQGIAYADHPLPIGEGQTISQPYIVALMTESLELTGEEKVLEIGTGSGYQAAVLAEIVDKVFTVEIIISLYQRSKEVLASYPNVTTSNHDGYYGWEEYAPFDRIIVTAAPDHIPQPLVEQLIDGGIMVLPVGPPGLSQTLWKVEKTGGEVISTKITDYVSFVPITRDIR